ncbi:LptF/LptG family permease [Ichthyenterobacterium sp. W332]|uniref:LptF/LptG family permease n=1 Tax=Microcosmobacter mediterraneus TaxID=3075607 RepID=A0ABU2YIY7_9FLAO|nr:LptF/LptG family permease [Ichthyenterobacterium sp. W332]MDT0557639.1 LptF/LptG family permease [Ichthyenterobacterium sp. W332]
MKILDRYILTTYLKTFLSVLIILMLIFILQAVWLYISELAGKDLDVGVIMKFLAFVTPTLIPLILPLTILVASIMVFGNFAENYEFAAMKSTGISLQRAMRGLSIFIVLLAVGAFFFANNVIPAANHNFYNLRNNIKKEKPAMAIAQGQFNQIGTDFNIKVNSKSGERGQFLEGVTIHQKKKNSSNKNYMVIKADHGELISSVDSEILSLKLIKGNYYEEVFGKDSKRNLRKPHAKSYFETYTINLDLGGTGDVDYSENDIDGKYNMLNVSGLYYTIDSLTVKRVEKTKTLSNTLYNRSTIGTLNNNINPKQDTLNDSNLLDLFTIKQKENIFKLALNSTNSTVQILEANKKSLAAEDKWRNQHLIALHEKYVLSFACIILFFVGAPLGALIRKGGIGLPMVIAVLLFLTYHFIGIFSKNSAKNGTFNPVLATWLSTLIMLPLSIYLTNRATKDRGLLEFDILLEPLRRLFKIKSQNRLVSSEGTDYRYFENFNNQKLTAIVKDYTKFDYEAEASYLALSELQRRKVKIEQLSEYGLETNKKFDAIKSIYTDYIDYSKAALTGFLIGGILIALHFIFKNNKLPQIADASIQLGIISLVFFLIYFIVSHYYYSKFYTSIDRKEKRIHPLLLLLSIPLYPIELFFTKFRVKKDFNRTFIESI